MPAISIRPVSASSSPAMIRSSVDLPPPLGPSSAVSCPVGMDDRHVVEGDEVAEPLADSVQRIWRAHGLRPHLVRRFKLSNDPQFAAKLQEIVGLYVNPPDHAIVLSVDEKSQIQALDRTQPGLPMKKGRAGTITHDYKRHGVTTLFAALNVLDGKVIGQCMKRHRHQEFIRFLNVIDARVAEEENGACDRRQLCRSQAPEGS